MASAGDLPIFPIAAALSLGGGRGALPRPWRDPAQASGRVKAAALVGPASVLDGDFLGLGLSAGRLGDGQLEHALVVARIDLVRIDVEWQADGARELAVAALGAVGLAFLRLDLGLLLAGDGEHVVVGRDLDVLLLDAR